MGKVSASSSHHNNQSDSAERIKKKKRKKDLEEIRRNALAIKRELRSKPSTSYKEPKTKLMKTLNQIASLRTDIEEANHTQGTLLKKPSPQLEKFNPKPLIIDGFFRAGVKGKLLTRPCSDATQEKLRNAVLQSNPLALMQSGGINCGNSNTHRGKESSSVNNPSLALRKQVEKILQGSSESSSDESLDLGNLSKSSPILGSKCKKKILQSKSEEKTKSSNDFNKNNLPITNNIFKDEKFRRRLFEEEHINKPNSFIKSSNIQQNEFRLPLKNPSSENTTFFSKQNFESKSNKKTKSCFSKIDPSDPLLIKYYIQTCKIIAKKEVKNISWSNVEDPLEVSKSALKILYAETFAEFVKNEKNGRSHSRSCSKDHTPSSSSEIMLEPDSAIARILKKNSKYQYQSDSSTVLEKDNEPRPSCSKNSENNCRAESDVNKNDSKRKRTPSSKEYNAQFFSSIKANVDPKSIRIDLKMNYIHPDKQELVARYLNDVSINNSIGNNSMLEGFDNGDLLSNDDDKESYSVQKCTKYVPAILRKNKSSQEKSSLEDKINSNVKKHSNFKETLNQSLSQLDSDSFVTERTPDFLSLESTDAPKCKFEHINAKYKKPFRINFPQTQNKKNDNNNVPQRRLFSMKDFKKNVEAQKQIVVSPNSQPVSLKDDEHDKVKCYISQEKPKLEDNCMKKMISFNDIQERTNRLTLRSSQNYSEENINLFSTQDDRRNLHSNYYIQQSEIVPSKCITFGNTSRVEYKEVPTPLAYNHSRHSHHNYQPVNFVKKTPFEYKTDYQLVQSPFHPSIVNQKSAISCISTHPDKHTALRQPIKFIAVEGNRVPQRLPIYSSNEQSCSHSHKELIPNPQYIQAIKSRQVYKVPSVTVQKHQIPQTITSSNFDVNEYNQLGRIVRTSIQLSDLDQSPVLLNDATNFVPSSLSSQNCVSNKNVTLHSMNNERLVGQHRIIEVSSPVCSQVEYQQKVYVTNEGGQVKTVYFQPVNQNVHYKRT